MEYPGYETLLVERTGYENRVAIITLNRPQRMNSLTTQMGLDMKDLFDRIRHDREVRAVILTGSGQRAFCTGADLKERDGMTDEDFQLQHQIFEEALFEQLQSIPVPVIAAVEGFCLAGGFEMALGCDFIIAGDTAEFGLPEVTRGIMPGGGGTVWLPRLAGRAFAKEAILTGRRFSAAEALSRNILTRVVPAGQALSEAISVAGTIAQNAPISVRQAKKAIDRGLDMDVHNALVLTIEAYNILIGTDDRREGIRAFVEKRPPHFSNR